jgi:hypothetical protein
MKAAGRAETAMDITKSISQCLDLFSVGTDPPRKPPSLLKSMILDCFVTNEVGRVLLRSQNKC